jgi:TetR/AcrR family transcriptional regulator, regulator of cefoperazone and chloramphenicol sensitivity
MRSINLEQDDLTARARLRETALALFADHGIAATSLRSIAAAAGVSPGLVIHHFGSKDGLRRAVDAVVVKRITAALSEVSIGSSGASLIDQRAEVLARVLRPQPALLQYIAQALSESGPAAGELFALLYATASADQALADAGVIRTDSDPLWRALQQLILIIGPLLLRPLIEQQLGGSLFEPANFERWMRANADLLKHGLYTPPAPSPPARTSPTEPSHTGNPERGPRER